MDTRQLRDLSDLNARLWAWIEGEYHRRPHGALEGLTPLERWRKDLIQIRPLGRFSEKLDDLFCHRHKRKVRKDGSISFNGKFYEVPYELSGETIILVVDPHNHTAIQVESEAGVALGGVVELDRLANLHRKRRSPKGKIHQLLEKPRVYNLVELAFENYQQDLQITSIEEENNE